MAPAGTREVSRSFRIVSAGGAPLPPPGGGMVPQRRHASGRFAPLALALLCEIAMHFRLAAPLLPLCRTMHAANLGVVFAVASFVSTVAAPARADDPKAALGPPVAAASTPLVHIDGPPGVRLERALGTVILPGRYPAREAEVYTLDCLAPCDRRLAPGTYRLVRPGYVPTPDFGIASTDHLRLEPDFSRDTRGFGLAGVIAGGVMLVDAGVFIGVADAGVSAHAQDFGMVGGFMLLAGVALLGIGVPLLVLPQSSVAVRAGEPGREARAYWLPNGVAF